MALVRAKVIALMRKAQRAGQSASSFIADMKAEGLSYRRTVMLADWRSVGQLEKKAGVIRYVRKDYYPTEKSIAQVDWMLSKEYMYKVRTHYRVKPDEPLQERFVNIMSDRPMTPREVEAQVTKAWITEWRYTAEELEELQVWTAVHKEME